jgi:hypothetical protein
MQQLELMPANMAFPSKTDMRKRFTTLDDLIDLADALTSGLHQLGERKHPLAVRKARVERREVSAMKEVKDSRQIKAGSRTYFVDIETTKENKPYLRITESRFKGEGKERERQSILVFPEEAQEFAKIITEMVGKLS